MAGEHGLEHLQRCRRDRLVLLEFVLSGSLVKKFVLPAGAASLADVDLDQVSVDYVLNCVKKGEVVELSEAIREYHDGSKFPRRDHGSLGSPPRRPPPPVPSRSFRHSLSRLSMDDIEDFEDDHDMEGFDSPRFRRKTPNEASDLLPLLPPFATGTSNDDLRETAYEILLACAGASDGLVVPQKAKKKGRRARLLSKFKRHKAEELLSRSQHAPGLAGLLETMRFQMEISEATDMRTRQGLVTAVDGKPGKRMDALLVPLELLCCVPRSEFPDEKAYTRWKKRQLNILEEGLINHPAVDLGESMQKANELKALLARIEESDFLPASEEDLQTAECLRSLRHIALPLAERPADGETGEVCHWADGYHFNVRLYEKLLLSVFDILDDTKFVEDLEEILELFRSTWRVLRITETIHHICYAWVLIHQFMTTSEQGMLQLAVDQLNKIPSKEQRSQQEGLYLNSLQSKIEDESGSRNISFLQAFLEPIQMWADSQLEDYHLHVEDKKVMENIATVAMICRSMLAEELESGTQPTSTSDRDLIESFVTSSVKFAFARALRTIDSMSETGHEHHLALLAEEMKKLLKKENTVFVPVFSKWHSQVLVVSTCLTHRLYGTKLRPFLDEVEHLTEEVGSVFAAAHDLEQYILGLLMSELDEEADESHCKQLARYQIETLSGTLLMHWINGQLQRIMSWVERVVQQEKWDPISSTQRYGSSIVDFYRIVDETVDQFFALRAPMSSDQLSCLCCGIDNAFQVYANLVVDNLGSKDDLIRPVPVLTRYGKETAIKAFVKKEILDQRKAPDEKILSDVLPTPVLCIQLNTLHYAESHLSKLEDHISEQWSKKKPSEMLAECSLDDDEKSFNGGRKDLNAAIDRICEYTGTKIVFQDLREPFIDGLYKPSVSESRLELLMDPLDLALNQLCTIIMEPLRNKLVTSLLQASLDGLLRVLLDGGSSRIFYLSDAKLIEDDLEVLQEFFICGGDGLPCEIVENLLMYPRQIIKLHSYETQRLTEELISKGGLEQGGKSKLNDDTKTLLKILCHRGEPEASKFVKKHFKIPKAVS